MKNGIDSQLGFGPMSTEIVESIVKASAQLKRALMLICTQNQIDWNGGYVNNWKTNEYVEHVNKLRKKYPESRVYLCRDHCGPGFKNSNIDDVYRTLSDDIENNFDLIHIDFSKADSDKMVVLRETKRAILYILKKTDRIKIEVGTEENVGAVKDSITEIKKEISLIKEHVNPEFFVVQTGSLVKEINQVGKFNRDFISEVHNFLASVNIKLKEHNADYLNKKMILERRGLVDAMNVAPQLGVIQTCIVLNKALVYGIDISDFIDVSYKSKKWLKWLHNNTASDRMLCSIIAGHYNYTSDEYKRIIYMLEKQLDINRCIIDEVVNLITFYSETFIGA